MATIVVDSRARRAQDEQFQQLLNIRKAEAVSRGVHGLADNLLEFSKQREQNKQDDLSRIATLATTVGGLDKLYTASPEAFGKFEDLLGTKFARNADGTPNIPIPEKMQHERMLESEAIKALSDPTTRNRMLKLEKPTDPSGEKIAEADRANKKDIAILEANAARERAAMSANATVEAARIRSNATGARASLKTDNKPSGFYRLPDGTTTSNPRIAAKHNAPEITIGEQKFFNGMKNDRLARGKTTQQLQDLKAKADSAASDLALSGAATPLLKLAKDAKLAGNKDLANQYSEALRNEVVRTMPDSNPLKQFLVPQHGWLWNKIWGDAHELRTTADAQTAVDASQKDAEDAQWHDLLDKAGVPK